MADQKLTQLIPPITSYSSGDRLYIVINPNSSPSSEGIEVDSLFGAIPVDVEVSKSVNDLTKLVVENTNSGNAAISLIQLINDTGIGGLYVYSSNFAAIPDFANKMLLDANVLLDGLILNAQKSGSSISFRVGGTEMASISESGTTGIVSKTSGVLTDGATVTVNGASKDQATFDWTANTASVSLVFSSGTAAQITSIFGKKTLAGDVTVALDTTNYHFVDNDGADITSLTITNDSTTNKYFALSFLKSDTFTESSKPVIEVLTSSI